MNRLFILVLSVFLLGGCGPEVTIDIDSEQTRVIYDEELEMVSFYVRLENTGTLPANDLYARFILDHPTVQQSIGGKADFLFQDSEGNLEVFRISPDSSYFIAEAFSLEAEINEEDLVNTIHVEIYDSRDQILTEHTFSQVTNE
ncbi:hypothetical protein [Halalkalibacter alkalisediminis]|uniref:Intracellular proteinase inhibitor BsuPI domain-containing protein n=1 Tax=Halalkalibacter alkalisediminis TaxID=935616 RepID=A0ABV6NAA5_9BACI|nr:hypothetical protein [Halalkalibacter alkalisediminis]